MTDREILEIAMRQSAIDSGCAAEDFESFDNVIVGSKADINARKYLTLPFVCNLTTYGNNIVASIDMKYYDIVSDYINSYRLEHCFETPIMHFLDDAFAPHGYRVCFMAEYFLPDMNTIKARECPYELRMLSKKDFDELYLPQWDNALCESRKELDVLGVAAYDGKWMAGLAACSADCRDMWQIGVDVLPEYRREGVASALTSRLALEILERGKVPFYCCAWSNIPSARNAIRSGFRPAWAEMTVKTAEFVRKMSAEWNG